MRIHTRPRRRPDVAEDDVLRVVEAGFAGHTTFGDSRSVLARKRSIVWLQLEAVARGRPLLQKLCRELRQERNRRAAVDVLQDPVVVRSIVDLLGSRVPRPHNETEDIFATVLHYLWNRTPGIPVATGCALRFHPNDSTPPIALWEPTASPTPVKRRFDSLVKTCIPSIGTLERPDPAFRQALQRAYDLLSIILPELSALVLSHIRVLGAFNGRRSGAFSMSSTLFPSTTFISNISVSPWHIASVLLHEALHNKLTDIIASRSIVRSAAEDGPRRIRAIWHSEQGNKADWSIVKAFYVFHVYVHMTLFFARIERMEASATVDFGAPPTRFKHRFEVTSGRAGYLGEELAAHADKFFHQDDRTMFAWLRRMLFRICDAEELRARVERLRELSRTGTAENRIA